MRQTLFSNVERVDTERFTQAQKRSPAETNAAELSRCIFTRVSGGMMVSHAVNYRNSCQHSVRDCKETSNIQRTATSGASGARRPRSLTPTQSNIISRSTNIHLSKNKNQFNNIRLMQHGSSDDKRVEPSSRPHGRLQPLDTQSVAPLSNAALISNLISVTSELAHNVITRELRTRLRNLGYAHRIKSHLFI